MSFSLTDIAHIFAACFPCSSFKLCMYNVLTFMKCIYHWRQCQNWCRVKRNILVCFLTSVAWAWDDLKKKIKKQFLSINWVPLLQKTPLLWFYLGPFDNHRCPGWDFCHWVALKYIETRKTLWKGIYTLSMDSGEVFHEGVFLKDFYNLLFDSELWNWEKVILIWLCYNTCFALLILLSI